MISRYRIIPADGISITIVAFIAALVIIGIFVISGYNFENFDRNNNNNIVYAHFFGPNKTIDNYKIVFQLIPSILYRGDNATLNFSILDKDNANVNNVFAALIIKEKDTNKVISQIPYKFYEFSDITFPTYKFQNNGRYLATLETRIGGDAKYESKPLVSTFDFSISNKPLISFTGLMYYIVIPIIIIIGGLAEYLLFFRKNKKNKKEEQEQA